MQPLAPDKPHAQNTLCKAEDKHGTFRKVSTTSHRSVPKTSKETTQATVPGQAQGLNPPAAGTWVHITGYCHVSSAAEAMSPADWLAHRPSSDRKACNRFCLGPDTSHSKYL